MELFAELGHDPYGCDFIEREETRRKLLEPIFGSTYSDHVRITEDEARIPFDNGSFDVIYANAVFEHVRLFSTMVRECARVLVPGGTVIASLPLVTVPLELHLRVPFAHLLPSGELRVRYLEALRRWQLRLKGPGMSNREAALHEDNYVRNQTYYRLLKEILRVGEYYFKRADPQTSERFRAWREVSLLEKSPVARRRSLLKVDLALAVNDKFGEGATSSLFGCTLMFQCPRKERLDE